MKAGDKIHLVRAWGSARTGDVFEVREVHKNGHVFLDYEGLALAKGWTPRDLEKYFGVTPTERAWSYPCTKQEMADEPILDAAHGIGTPNPKDAAGAAKPKLSNVPMRAVYEMASAMDDGAKKYGQVNWRGHPVLASVYYDAALRHLTAWFDGEDKAADSGIDHRAHAMACMAVIIDASHHGCLIDDRPKSSVPLSTYFAERQKFLLDPADNVSVKA